MAAPANDKKGECREKIADALTTWSAGLTVGELAFVLDGKLTPLKEESSLLTGNAKALVEDGFSQQKLGALVNIVHLQDILKPTFLKSYKRGTWLAHTEQLKNKRLPFWYALDMHNHNHLPDRADCLVFADTHAKVYPAFYWDKLVDGLRLLLPEFAGVQDAAYDFLGTLPEEMSINRELFMLLVEKNWYYLARPVERDIIRLWGKFTTNMIRLMSKGGRFEDVLAYHAFSIFTYLQILKLAKTHRRFRGSQYAHKSAQAQNPSQRLDFS